MDQPALFYEDIYDALRAAVQAIGGAKVVGPMLWPQKPVAEAQRDILDALNRDRPRKLDAEEIMLVLSKARAQGFHGAMHFLAGEVGYQAIPVEPDDEKAALQREFIEAAKRLDQIGARIERLTTPALSRAA